MVAERTGKLDRRCTAAVVVAAREQKAQPALSVAVAAQPFASPSFSSGRRTGTHPRHMDHYHMASLLVVAFVLQKAAV